MFSCGRDRTCAVISAKFGGYRIPSRGAIAITVSWSDGSTIIGKRSTFKSAVIRLEFPRRVARRCNVLNLRRRISRAPPRDAFRSSNADAIRRGASNGRLGRTFRKVTVRGPGGVSCGGVTGEGGE